ncbi:preprotein translocase subunit SecA [compost metagenome]
MNKYTPMNTIIREINKALHRQKLKPYYAKLEDMKRIHIESWSDEKLKEHAKELQNRAQSGIPLNDLIMEAAVLVAEVIWRLMGIRLYDAQWVAGMALHEGHLVEMQTGEGKTLAAVLPAFLNALEGKGVHIFTFNDYLASRDAAWMGPIYQYLGLTVGCVKEEQSFQDRKAAYAADITYLTAKQAGFDYLKDSLVYDKSKMVQLSFHYVLVDEADSILIDEAGPVGRVIRVRLVI